MEPNGIFPSNLKCHGDAMVVSWGYNADISWNFDRILITNLT
jgi:hypothetical protein